jgi:hypothetical protein
MPHQQHYDRILCHWAETMELKGHWTQTGRPKKTAQMQQHCRSATASQTFHCRAPALH